MINRFLALKAIIELLELYKKGEISSANAYLRFQEICNPDEMSALEWAGIYFKNMLSELDEIK